MLPGCVQRLYQQLSPPVPVSQLHEVGLCSWPCPLSAEQGAQQEAGRAGSTPKGCHPVPVLLLPRYSLFPSGISPSGSANTENDAAETHPGHPPAPQPLLLRVLDSPTHAEAAGIAPLAPSRGAAAKAPSPAAPAPPCLLLAHQNSEELGAAAAALHGDPSSGKPLPSERLACSRRADYSSEHTQSDTRPPFRSSGLGQRRSLGDSPSSAFIRYSVPVRLRFPFSLSIFYVLLLSPPLPREAGAPGRSSFAPTEAAPRAPRPTRSCPKAAGKPGGAAQGWEQLQQEARGTTQPVTTT